MSAKRTLIAALGATALSLGAGCGNDNVTNATRNVTNRSASAPMAAGNPSATSDQPSAAGSPSKRLPASPGDAATTAKVKAALLVEPGVSSMQINVDTRDRVVSLNGNVPSQQQKERALRVAQNVDGVKQVVDNLSVVSAG